MNTITVAHTPTEVLLWQAPSVGGQRVVRLHASGPALVAGLAAEGRKPTTLSATWLSRAGFEALVAQALPDPDCATLGKAGTIDKATLAQHRLATRYAQVRVVLEPELDAHGRSTGRLAPSFSVRNAARHSLADWVARIDRVDVRSWASGDLDKAYLPRPYPVEPAVWSGWVHV